MNKVSSQMFPQTKIMLGLGASFVVLLGALFISWHTARSLIADRLWVEHSYQVMQQLDQIKIGLFKAETTQRQYLLTEDTQYVHNYLHERERLDNDFACLKQMTSDNVRQQTRIDSLIPLIRRKREFQDQVFSLYKSAGFLPTRRLVSTGEGVRLMSDVQSGITAMVDEEKQLLRLRLQKSDETTKLVLLSLAALTLIASILVIATLYLLQFYQAKSRKYEEELQDTASKLARSNADLEQFAYIASHDLNEPLRTITGYMQLLSRRYKGQLDQEANEFINYATSGAERMRRLINDLLQYSKVGRQAKPFTPVDLNAIFTEVMANLESLIQSTNARVTAEKLPTVSGDSVQLSQLIQNLIANAIKFHGKETPQVAVTCSLKNDREWIISVRDNGIGIDEKYQKRIFEIFQRLHTEAEYPGTGIGLALCQKIVERHGGRIWVESAAGAGSTFSFTFPVLKFTI